MFVRAITFICLLASTLSQLMFVSIALAVVFFTVKTIYNKTLSYEKFIDTATVISTECDDSVMFTPDYFVYVNYQGKEFCITDERLYAKAVAGGNVAVYVHKGYDRSDKMRAMYLTAC